MLSIVLSAVGSNVKLGMLSIVLSAVDSKC